MVLAEGTDSLLMRQKLPEEFKMVAVILMVLMEHPLQLQCPHFSIHGCFAFVSTNIYRTRANNGRSLIVAHYVRLCL